MSADLIAKLRENAAFLEKKGWSKSAILERTAATALEKLSGEPSAGAGTKPQCERHAPEYRAVSTLPCPWCVISELKANSERLRSELPPILFDGYRVFSSLAERDRKRVGVENVAMVLDAVVRLAREESNADGERAAPAGPREKAASPHEPSARCAVCDHLEELHAPFNLQHAFVAKSPAEPSENEAALINACLDISTSAFTSGPVTHATIMRFFEKYGLHMRMMDANGNRLKTLSPEPGAVHPAIAAADELSNFITANGISTDRDYVQALRRMLEKYNTARGVRVRREPDGTKLGKACAATLPADPPMDCVAPDCDCSTPTKANEHG